MAVAKPSMPAIKLKIKLGGKLGHRVLRTLKFDKPLIVTDGLGYKKNAEESVQSVHSSGNKRSVPASVPVLKKHKQSDLSEEQPKKKLKIDSGISSKSFLFKGSESKGDIIEPAQHYKSDLKAKKSDKASESAKEHVLGSEDGTQQLHRKLPYSRGCSYKRVRRSKPSYHTNVPVKMVKTAVTLGMNNKNPYSDSMGMLRPESSDVLSSGTNSECWKAAKVVSNERCLKSTDPKKVRPFSQPTNGTAVDASTQGREKLSSGEETSVKKARRAEMLKSRFADVISKARKQIGNDYINQTSGLKEQEKETMKRKNIEKEREAARIAIQKMEACVDIEDNLQVEREFIKLCGSSHCNKGFDSKKRLGLIMKNDDEAEEGMLTEDIKEGKFGSKLPDKEKSRRKKHEKEREAARIAIQKMKKSVDIEDNLRVEREFAKLCGCALYSKRFGIMEKLGLFIKNDDDDEHAMDEAREHREDIEEGEIVEINKTVHGSKQQDKEISRRMKLEKEREAARNAIQQMKASIDIEDNLKVEREFRKLCGHSLYRREFGLVEKFGFVRKERL